MTRMLDPRVKVVVLLFVNLLMYSSIAYWVEALCVLAITLALLYQQQYKTTLTRLLNGLVPSFYEGKLSGEVLIEGKPVSEYKDGSLSQKVGSVFQNPRSQFFNVDTTGEIAFGCENIGISHEQILERVSKASYDLEMGGLMNRDIFSLSGGEKQLVAIASVYAMNPDIYVMDEPSANLDMEVTERLKKIITLLKRQGKTIIIAEHRIA